MHLGGPIVLAMAAAVASVWTQTIFWQLIPIPTDGHVTLVSGSYTNSMAWAQTIF